MYYHKLEYYMVCSCTESREQATNIEPCNFGDFFRKCCCQKKACNCNCITACNTVQSSYFPTKTIALPLQ